MIFGETPYDSDIYKVATNELKGALKVINTHLSSGNKKFLVGNGITLADIHLFVSTQHVFQLIFDNGYRNSIKGLSTWFDTLSKLPEIRERLGNVKAAKRLYNINEIMML